MEEKAHEIKFISCTAPSEQEKDVELQRDKKRRGTRAQPSSFAFYSRMNFKMQNNLDVGIVCSLL